MTELPVEVELKIRLSTTKESEMSIWSTKSSTDFEIQRVKGMENMDHTDDATWNPPRTQAVVCELWSNIESATTESLKQQVRAFCRCLSDGLTQHGIEDPLPAFYTIREDDEFYMEWIFDRCRFGFDFFDDRTQSAWFVLIRRDEGMFRHNSGFDQDYCKSIDYVLSVIRSVNADPDA